MHSSPSVCLIKTWCSEREACPQFQNLTSTALRCPAYLDKVQVIRLAKYHFIHCYRPHPGKPSRLIRVEGTDLLYVDRLAVCTIISNTRKEIILLYVFQDSYYKSSAEVSKLVRTINLLTSGKPWRKRDAAS